MGSHGNLGGLARKAQDVGDLLAASGKEIVIYETVGVGQGEYEVAKAADISIVVLVPESGDEVQLMKAGLIEIADLFVINKSDREGGQRLSQELRSILKNSKSTNYEDTTVLNTVASKGEGITELYEAIFATFDSMNNNGTISEKRKQRFRDRITSIVQERLYHEFWTENRKEQLAKEVATYSVKKNSPRAVAEQIIKAVENE
jgi:LAO/AO transport system kinase